MARVLRPEPVVLGESAVVPAENLIRPPPDQFTHVLTRAAPFTFGGRRRRADGEFPAGTPVVLLVHDGGPRCRVADGRGLYVEIDFDALKKLRRRG
jgi:hypothetical protein